MIDVERLFKIHGPRDRAALDRLRRGETRDKISADGHVVAVEDVSFHVEQGSTYVVMGLSGSGKSTLVRCINRLHEPTSGKVVFGGEDITQASKARLRQIRGREIAMVFQSFALIPHRNVLDNVALGLELQGMDANERNKKALSSLELVGLSAWSKRRPAELSGGMQQRVGLARALAVDPDVLLLDEPFSGLDPLTRKEMQRELIDLQTELRKTVIFITHDLDEALLIGDVIGIMKAGRLVQEGTPQDVVCNPAESYVADFVGDVNPLIVLTADLCMTPLLEGPCNLYKCMPRVPAETLLKDLIPSLASSPARTLLVEDQLGEIIGTLTADDVIKAISARRILPGNN